MESRNISKHEIMDLEGMFLLEPESVDAKDFTVGSAGAASSCVLF